MTAAHALSLELERFDGHVEARRFSVTEAMSSAFDLQIEAVSADPHIDLDAIVGYPARFTLEPVSERARCWSGVCSGMEQIGAPTPEGLTRYALTIVPLLWLCSQRRNRRIFQRLSDPDIVCALLDEWEIPYVRRLDDALYRRREFRVQYGESDYAFIRRLLEDAGISFYFDADSQVVLNDAPERNDPRPPLPFADAGLLRRDDHVSRVRLRRVVKPGVATLQDHDLLQSDRYRLEGQAKIDGDSHEAQLEGFYFEPGAFNFEDDGTAGPSLPTRDARGRFRRLENEGQRAAERQLAAIRSAARRIQLHANAPDLRPGTVMSIVGHPHDWVREDRRLLVLRSVLHGAHDRPTQLQCEAVDADRPYAPPVVTPKPSTRGVESAVVVGPPGEDIHTNELGQVRVHFHWDRESKMDEDSSCWLHVSQPWAGTGFGSMSLPRVGQQVLVDFVGGDPEQPIVVGRVFTGVNRGPYSLPENKTRSGWRSMSTPDGEGFNELMFEDAKGRELLSMQAERDMSTLVKNDLSISVGGTEARTVSANATLAVREDHEISVGGTHRLDVSSALTASVGQSSTELVGATKTIQAAGGINMSSPGGSMRLTADGTLVINARRVVFDSADVSVAGQLFANVAAPKAGGQGVPPATAAPALGTPEQQAVAAAYAPFLRGPGDVPPPPVVPLMRGVNIGELLTRDDIRAICAGRKGAPGADLGLASDASIDAYVTDVNALRARFAADPSLDLGAEMLAATNARLEALGIPPVGMVPSTGFGSSGMYDSATHTIWIDEGMLQLSPDSPYFDERFTNLAQLMYHEARHAEQTAATVQLVGKALADGVLTDPATIAAVKADVAPTLLPLIDQPAEGDLLAFAASMLSDKSEVHDLVVTQWDAALGAWQSAEAALAADPDNPVLQRAELAARMEMKRVVDAYVELPHEADAYCTDIHVRDGIAETTGAQTPADAPFPPEKPAHSPPPPAKPLVASPPPPDKPLVSPLPPGKPT